MTQLLICLTHNRSVVSSTHNKGSFNVSIKKVYPCYLVLVWFQERIRAWFKLAKCLVSKSNKTKYSVYFFPFPWSHETYIHCLKLCLVMSCYLWNTMLVCISFFISTTLLNSFLLPISVLLFLCTNWNETFRGTSIVLYPPCYYYLTNVVSDPGNGLNTATSGSLTFLIHKPWPFRLHYTNLKFTDWDLSAL